MIIIMTTRSVNLSVVVLFAPQAFDAHGKEEKLAPGVYNLVRDFYTLMIIYCLFYTTFIEMIWENVYYSGGTQEFSVSGFCHWESLGG